MYFPQQVYCATISANPPNNSEPQDRAVGLVDVKDGDLVYIESVRATFVYDRFNSETADGITVVALPRHPWGGRLVRTTNETTRWGLQTAWFLDPTNGNDEYDGTSATVATNLVGPIKTNAELARRLGTPFTPMVDITVTYVSSTPATDPLNITITGGSSDGVGGVLKFTGTETSLHTGTFTAVTAKNSATNTASQVRDGALDWSPYVEKFIVITASATPGNIGGVAVIAKNVGGGVARTTTWMQALTNFDPIVEFTPSIGDSYKVVSYAGFAPGALFCTYQYGANHACPWFDKLTLNAAGFPTIHTGQMGPLFTNVDMGTYISMTGTFSNLRNCIFRGTAFYGGSHTLQGGLVTYDTLYLQIGANTSMTNDILAQGIYIFSSSAATLYMNNVAVFDSTNTVLVGNGSVVKSVGAFWGSGNTAACQVDSGCFFFSASAPTVTNTSGFDFTLGGKTSVFALDPATGLPGTARTLTWTHWSAAYGAGGFGQQAVDAFTNSGFILYS